MPTPTHKHPPRRSRDLFTNRHRAKEQFRTALEKPQAAEEYRILVWAAPGGQGKTALLEEFERIIAARNEREKTLSAPRTGYALIDFNSPENRSISAALLSIREKLAKTTGRLFFPAFDAAYLRYVTLTQPGASVRDVRAKVFSSGSDTLDAILQTTAAIGENVQWIPGFAGLSLISKFGSKGMAKAARAFHDWWQERGDRIFLDIDELPHDALLRKLPSYLGHDLMDTLASGRVGRLVILLDTYEALWRGQGMRDGPAALRIDDWVRLFAQDAPGVLFVIAGRHKLHWDEIDPQARWNDVIEFHALGGLNRLDAEAVLTKWDIVDPKIRARIIAGARSQEFGEVDPSNDQFEGYLPFYLQVQAQTHDNIKAADKTPLPDDFGGDHPQILARFLEHLDLETDRLLRIASYPGALSEDVLDMLAETFLGGRASADWSPLYGQTLVSDERDGERFLHDLLRRALQDRERATRPDHFRSVHKALFAWFEERCGAPSLKTVTENQERSLLSAIRHLSRFDEAASVRWANRQMERLSAAARWRALEEACQLTLPLAEAARGADDEWTTAILSWLARVYSDTGRYAEAETLFERVRAIYEKTLGPEHPSFAATLHNLAGVYRDTGRYAEAETLFERVRAIEEKALGPEHPSFAATLYNLAGVYSDTGRYAEAETLFERVRAIYEKTLGPEHPSFAATLHNLAGVYRDTGRYAEAETLFERVRAIEEKALGPEHPSFAATLHNLARVYSDTGRYAEAETLFERVRAIDEKTLGPEHPSFAATLHNLARVYSDTGRYAEAETLFERVRAIDEKTLGPEHPSFAATLANLAGVYSDTGRYAEAETLFERVRAIYEKTLGPEHPSFAATLHELARVYSDTGRYAEAETLFERVRAVYEKTLGPEHPFFATTLRGLASVCRDTGRYAEAETLYATALRVLSAKLSPRHPRVARVLVGRGQLHARLRHKAAAKQDFAEAVQIFEAAGVRPEERWHRQAREALALLE